MSRGWIDYQKLKSDTGAPRTGDDNSKGKKLFWKEQRKPPQWKRRQYWANAKTRTVPEKADQPPSPRAVEGALRWGSASTTRLRTRRRRRWLASDRRLVCLPSGRSLHLHHLWSLPGRWSQSSGTGTIGPTIFLSWMGPATMVWTMMTMVRTQTDLRSHLTQKRLMGWRRRTIRSQKRQTRRMLQLENPTTRCGNVQRKCATAPYWRCGDV